jgi:hypothetical protein
LKLQLGAGAHREEKLKSEIEKLKLQFRAGAHFVFLLFAFPIFAFLRAEIRGRGPGCAVAGSPREPDDSNILLN